MTYNKRRLWPEDVVNSKTLKQNIHAPALKKKWIIADAKLAKIS